MLIPFSRLSPSIFYKFVKYYYLIFEHSKIAQERLNVSLKFIQPETIKLAFKYRYPDSKATILCIALCSIFWNGVRINEIYYGVYCEL